MKRSFSLWPLRLLCWVLIVNYMLIGHMPSALAQCPDANQVYIQLNKAADGDDMNRIIRQLLALQQTILRCQIENDSVCSKLLHVLGRTYMYNGDLERGMFYTRKAIALNIRQSSTASEANLTHSYYNAGNILIDQMLYQQAITMFDSCILIARRYPAKYTSGANAYASKAYLYFVLGDYDQSLRSAELGFNLAHMSGDASLMVKNLIQQAQTLLEVQKYVQAQTVLLKALTVAQASAATDEIASIYTRLADVNKKLGAKKEVIHYYELAYRVNLKASYPSR